MSKFCGKADFYDSLYISTESEEDAFNKFNGTKLYIRQPLPNDFNFEDALKNKINIPETYYKKVEYSSIKDLIPLYPHLISFSCGDVVCLSLKSWVDIEERDILEWRLKHFLRVYNRCKRKKIEFNVEEALKEVVWNGYNEEPYRELANRVKEKGKKANINGIHLKIHERYRKDLVEEMLKHGLNPIEYGDYERFIK